MDEKVNILMDDQPSRLLSYEVILAELGENLIRANCGKREIMRSYAETALKLPDVALQLPTGSGKTLVGLLIAEWRRRKNQERVVYLCTTRQLVNQVVEQAEEKYGLTVRGFTGAIRTYEPSAKAD
jgi:replicative superfamily II helicase